MGTITNIAEYRARRQLAGKPDTTALARAPTKEEVVKGVVAAYAKALGPARFSGLQTAVRALATAAVQAILAHLKGEGLMVGREARFQFFGVLDSSGYVVVGRVNRVCRPNSLEEPQSRLFLFDPVTAKVFPLSGVDNIAKNNTFTTLITLPASEFYNL